MTIQSINVGSGPNDHTGDPLRAAFVKINNNFSLLAGNLQGIVPVASGNAGKFLKSDGTDIVWSYLPSNNQLVNGSHTLSLTSGGALQLDGQPFTGGAGQTDRLVSNGHELVLVGTVPYVRFPTQDNKYTVIQGSEISAFGGDMFLSSATGGVGLSANAAGNRIDWLFDKSGTITTPLLFPVSFTAVLDVEHRTSGGDGTYTGPAWEFNLEWQVAPNGEVELIADNGPLPSLVNGYADGQTFEFTEADHGIPNYILTIVLSNVVQAGPAGWTANLGFSEPPVYPSTVNSLGAITLTSNENSLVLGTDGKLTLPSTGTIVNLYSAGVQIQTIQGLLRIGDSDGPTSPSHFHIRMDQNPSDVFPQGLDLFFGDDSQFLRLANDGAVAIQARMGAGSPTIVSGSPTESVNYNAPIEFTYDSGLVYLYWDGNPINDSDMVVISDSNISELNGSFYAYNITSGPYAGSIALYADSILITPVDPTEWSVSDNSGVLSSATLPGDAVISGGADTTGYGYPGDVVVEGKNVYIDAGTNEWTFSTDGSITFPDNKILQVPDSNLGIQTSKSLTTDNIIANGSEFNTDQNVDGFGVINGWSQRNAQQIEMNLFVAPAPIWVLLTGLALGRTVIVTYSTGSGNQTFTSVLSQLFTATGQYDQSSRQRYSGRINGTLPVGQTGIVSINFPEYSTQNNVWQFSDDGTTQLPDSSIIRTQNWGAFSLKSDNADIVIMTDVDNSRGWTFGADGTLTVPGAVNHYVANTSTPFSINSWQDIQLTTGDGVNTGYQNWTFDNAGLLTLPGGTTIGSAGFTAPLSTDFLINTFIDNTGDPGTKTWTFGTDGKLQLPAGGTVKETQFVSGGSGDDTPGTLVLTPNGVYNPWNNLTIYNTAFNPETQHIHLASGDLNRTEIVLGNDSKFVKVNIDGSVCVMSSPYYFEGAMAFEFQNDGANITEMHFSLGVYPRLYYVAVGDIITDVSNGNTATITGVDNAINLSITCNIPLDFTVMSPLGYSFSKPNNAGGLWQFGSDGKLTFPGSLTVEPNNNSPIFRTNNDFKIITDGTGNTWTFDSSGTLTLPSDETITDTKVTNWDTAYGWGDHSIAGYVTGTPWTSEGYVTGTPWTEAGYLTAEADTLDSVTTRGNTTTNDITVGDLTVSGEIKTAAGTGDVVIEANNGTARTWTFGGDGGLTLPNSTTISDSAKIVTQGPALNTFGSNGLIGSFSTLRYLVDGARNPVDTGWIVNGPGVVNGIVNGTDAYEETVSIEDTDGNEFQDGASYTFTSPVPQSVGSKITVHSNDWAFGNDGGLTFPNNTVQTTAYSTKYTGWFREANTEVALDNVKARITSGGDMQIATTITETVGLGAAFAWNGIRNKGAVMSAFGSGASEHWVLEGDWLTVANTLDNDFEVCTVTLIKLGGTGNVYRITYIGASNNKWSVAIERVAVSGS